MFFSFWLDQIFHLSYRHLFLSIFIAKLSHNRTLSSPPPSDLWLSVKRMKSDEISLPNKSSKSKQIK